MAYYHHVSMIPAPASEDDPTVEEQTEKFEEALGQRVSAENKAMELMRASMIARGLDPDAEPELSPELAARIEADEMKSDKDIFFSENINREFRGKKIKAGEDDFE